MRITVSDPTDGDFTIFTTTADAAGSWTLELQDVTNELVIDHEDKLTVSVSATDGVNNVSTFAPVTWTVDAISSTIQLTIDEEDRDPDISGGAFSLNATAGFAGSAEGDALIRVTVADEDGGATTFTTTADSAGSWTLELADVTNELTIDHMDLLTVNVSATDGVNNVTTMPTVTWTVDSIVEAISLTIDEEDRDPDSGGTFSINATAGISGSAEAGLVVRLTVNDGTESAVFLATADSTGSWTLELSDVNTLTIEHDEQLTVTATVMDAVGNVDTQNIGTWTVDAVTSPINLTIDDEDFDVDGAHQHVFNQCHGGNIWQHRSRCGCADHGC